MEFLSHGKCQDFRSWFNFELEQKVKILTFFMKQNIPKIFHFDKIETFCHFDCFVAYILKSVTDKAETKCFKLLEMFHFNHFSLQMMKFGMFLFLWISIFWWRSVPLENFQPALVYSDIRKELWLYLHTKSMLNSVLSLEKFCTQLLIMTTSRFAQSGTGPSWC